MENKESFSDTTLQQKLQEMLQREVHLMRELLSNMHQEEISLILHDQGSLHQLLFQRTLLLENLSSLRLNKQETLKQINPTHIPLEITSLGDQVEALMSKVHSQLSTNQRVSAHPEYYAQLLEASQIRPKKKVAIITLQSKQ